VKFADFLSQQRPNRNKNRTTLNLEDLDLISFSQTVDRNEKEREGGDSILVTSGHDDSTISKHNTSVKDTQSQSYDLVLYVLYHIALILLVPAEHEDSEISQQ